MKLSAWNKLEQIPVIYGIHNCVTNKWYIGSCHDLQDRVRRHYYALTHNTHHSPKLQHSWNKHGCENFELVILKRLNKDEIESMFTIEETFIKAFNSKDDGYNVLDTCLYVKKFNLSEEQSRKAGMTHAKSIYAIDRYTGEIVKEYSSISEAAKDLRTSTSNISQVCKHKHRVCKELVFVYSDEYDSSQDYRVPLHHMKNVAKSDEWKEKARLHNKRARKVYKYDVNNVLVTTYLSRSDAERQNHFKKEFLRTRMNKIIDGFIYTHEIKDIV